MVLGGKIMNNVITLTLNPCFDVTIFTDSLDDDKVSLVTDEVRETGGKGINVSKLLHTLDIPVKTYCMLGDMGKFEFLRLLGEEAGETHFSEVPGNVRENIITFSRMAPASAKYKVFIIDEVHMLSPSAFNALLKIIEEPPTYVMFILATTEVHKVPYTIISRCERFDFRRIGVSDVVSKLELIAKKEKKEVEPEVLEAIARRSGGHLRDAESLLGQIFSLGENKISLKQAELLMPHYNNNEVITLLSYFANKDTAKALTMINSLADSGVSIRNFISETISMLRKMAISKISPQLSDNLGLNLGDSVEIQINDLSGKLDLAQILLYIKRLLLAYSEKNQLILQLPLELAVIEICSQDASLKSSLNISDKRIDLTPGQGTKAQQTSATSPKTENKNERWVAGLKNNER